MVENLVLIFVLVVVSVASLVFIPALLTRRAVFKVIKIFCRYKALNAKNAKNAEELGLSPPGFFERMTRMRDYKPYALRLLKETKVVRTTRSGQLYMSEQKLNGNMRCSAQG